MTDTQCSVWRLRLGPNDRQWGQNPGLMQSHGGVLFNPKDERNSIFRMVKDGTQGTPHGDGLLRASTAGNIYTAARIYNSGSVAPNGDLSNGNGATPCYVSDIANRLTGWVNADTRCGGYFPVPILNLTVGMPYRRRAIRHITERHSEEHTVSGRGQTYRTYDRDRGSL
jgi:hypothetical protein